MNLFLETLIGGLLAGTMYSLVAIGFVLIYKASGVFNYAQGAILLFAALTFVSLTDQGVPAVAAVALTIAALVVLSVGVERLVLRPLTNRSPMTLFMATLGLSYIIEGVAQGLMGAQVRAIDLGIEDVPIFLGDILISRFDLIAAGVAGALVLGLSLLFNRTRIGVSLRGVADDTRAALSIGIDINRIWQIVWTVAGLVGLVAGLLWGARQGVQFSLSLIALKALPALVRGQVDLVISSDPEEMEGVTFQPLFDYAPTMVVPASHPLVAKGYAEPQDLAAETLITYPVERDRLDIFTRFLEPADIEPAQVRTSELTVMMMQLVASGRGVCCLPNWALHEYSSRGYVTAKRLGDKGLFATLYAGIRADMLDSPFMRDFLLTAKGTSFATLEGVSAAPKGR